MDENSYAAGSKDEVGVAFRDAQVKDRFRDAAVRHFINDSPSPVGLSKFIAGLQVFGVDPTPSSDIERVTKRAAQQGFARAHVEQPTWRVVEYLHDTTGARR